MRKIVPKLRFKEFKSEWKKIKLSNIAVINPKNSYLPDKFIYIDLESVNKGILSKKNIVNKNNAPSRAQRTVLLNDILFQTVRPYQQNNYFVKTLAELPYIASTGYALIRTTEIPYFIYTILHKKTFLNKVLDMCTGTSFPAINSNDLGTIDVKIPEKEEQEKISILLKLLDKKIELQQEKIENLKLYKKGLITNLLNKNQNTYFKNCFLHIGGTALEKYITTNSKYRFISIGNYSSEGTYIDNQQFVKFNEKTKEKLLNKDDLVMVLNDKTSQGKIIGSTILVEQNDLYIYNQRSERIICKENILPKYAWILLNSTSVRNYIFEKSQGGTQIYINFNEIEKMKLYVPDLIEQENIINTIFPLLKKIELQENKLKQLNDLRTSLLQQMFI